MRERALPLSASLVFVVLTAYHTIGGGALTQPYGDLVIFFVPPMFVIVGVAVVLIGMYVQWIRWRMHKPLSFARYPKWDLNLPRERKALLSVAIGAAILSVPAIYGSSQAYLYTDAVSFCGATCHSMTPEYVTYRALAARARDLRAMPRRGRAPRDTCESKIRGMLELVETVQNDYPRPIPVPVTALRPVRGNCERVSLASEFLRLARGASVHFLSDRAEHALGDRHVGSGRRWTRPRTHRDGNSLARGEQGRVYRERRRTAEYYLGARPWIRTGAAKVYTVPGADHSNAAAPVRSEPWIAWIVTTAPATSCKRRTGSVNAALADGRIDATLPFVKQQGVAALAAAYTSREQAMQGIENALLGYYRKTYPAVYTE